MSKSLQTNFRLRELDSLRGLAALSVVFHHYLLIFPQIMPSVANPDATDAALSPLLRALIYSPLHLVWAGYEAVNPLFRAQRFCTRASISGRQGLSPLRWVSRYLRPATMVMLVMSAFT